MTKFNSRNLLGKGSFRSLAGVEAAIFLKMVERLRPAWREKVVEPKDRDGRPWGIGGLEDHLLVLLILYRCAVPQDFLACLYGVDQSAISRAMGRIEKLAARILGVKRTIRVSREEAEALIIDATEQQIQRAGSPQSQSPRPDASTTWKSDDEVAPCRKTRRSMPTAAIRASTRITRMRRFP
jgi:hypothetical protein